MFAKLIGLLTPEVIVVLVAFQVFVVVALLVVIYFGYKLFKDHLKDSLDVQREMAHSISESKNAFSDLTNFLDGLLKGRGSL